MVTRLTTVAIAALTLIGGGMMAWVYPVPTMATSVTEPTNPFGWSDLAESLASSGDVTGAREAFAQSVRLGPKVPPILIRVVNFEVANGKLERAVPQIRQILELTNVYDNLVFRYLSRSGMESARILVEVIPDPGKGSGAALAQRTRTAGGHASAPEGDGRPKGDAGRAWAAYLLSERRPEAEAVYEWLQERGAVTAELRNRWVEYLVIVRKQYARAVETWAAAQIEPGYPAKNRVFDGRFVRPRTQGRLDWTVTAHPMWRQRWEMD